MYSQMNEDAVWQHLQDLQREMENSRLMAQATADFGKKFRILAARVWLLAGLAMQRPPRRRPVSDVTASRALAAWRFRSPNR